MTLHELQLLTDSQLYEVFSTFQTKWVRCTIPGSKHERIVRCVGLKSAEEEINCISRISYCPSQHLAAGMYNRCNLPKQEMFYGTLYGNDGDEIKEALITSIIEVSGLCHETSKQDEFYVSGEWLVTRDLVSFVIFDPTKPSKNSIFKDAGFVPLDYMASRPNEVFYDSSMIEAFSREVKDNSEYRVSALYSDYLFSKFPIDAIIYPSVRTGQAGICIAIRPSFVNSGGLQLIKTSKYRLFSAGDKMVKGEPYQHGHVDADTGLIRYEDIAQ